jgi:peptide-methionine (S)-S-oxide reductase
MLRFVLCAGLVVIVGAASSAEAADGPKEPATKKSTATPKKKADTSKFAKATFGGGCFWCMEAVFEHIIGVKDVVSGYAGGTTKKPYYDLVCTGTTGHAEVVQITYDPEVVTFEQLLDIFWRSHDPTTLNRQGPDFGTQYRSIVLFHNEEQQKATLKSYEELTKAQAFGAPIVTELVPLRVFYPAEKHHQDYYRKNKNAAYCQRTIAPKLLHLKQELQQRDAQRKAQP